MTRPSRSAEICDGGSAIAESHRPEESLPLNAIRLDGLPGADQRR
jgi:hypothetical protein